MERGTRGEGGGKKRGTFSKVSKSRSQVKVQLPVCPSNSSKEVKKSSGGVFKDIHLLQ
jgi:hypothetical protein